MLFLSLCLSTLSAVVFAQYSLKLLYQFPTTQQPVGLENLAVRSNGNLLLASVAGPVLYQLDPTDPMPQVVAALPSDTQALQGIAEISHDVFAISTGNFSINFSGPPTGVPGSFSIWTLDLNEYPSVQLLTAIPEASALDGATAVPGCPDLVLFADAGLGAIWQINTQTGAYKVAIQDPLFAPTAQQALGVNGIHFRDGYLYFTNSAQGLFGRVPYSYQNGNVAATGAAQKVASGATPQQSNFDDFAFNGKGTAWIATHPNSITAVTAYGSVYVAAGGDNSSALLDPAATAFDATGCKLYIVTQGAFNPPAGGQVFELNICSKGRTFRA